MGRIDQLRNSLERINARDFVAAGQGFSESVMFHAPGLGLEVEGRETVLDHVGRFVEQADVHYELERLVEHGPFVVAFQRSTGTIDGRRMAWDLCQVCRFDGDEITEVWALRGGAPQPTGS